MKIAKTRSVIIPAVKPMLRTMSCYSVSSGRGRKASKRHTSIKPERRRKARVSNHRSTSTLPRSYLCTLQSKKLSASKRNDSSETQLTHQSADSTTLSPRVAVDLRHSCSANKLTQKGHNDDTNGPSLGGRRLSRRQRKETETRALTQVIAVLRSPRFVRSPERAK